LVVDTSAIIAVPTEHDGRRFAILASEAETVAMSAVNACETRIVLSSRRRAPRFPDEVLDRLERWRLEVSVEIVPLDADQAVLAHAAHLRFGKGFHAAALNMADCAAHAPSRSRREALRFKGQDFAMTHVEPAAGAAP
jgi:ribonuclease VapC